jgi:hypothetical protein
MKLQATQKMAVQQPHVRPLACTAVMSCRSFKVIQPSRVRALPRSFRLLILLRCPARSHSLPGRPCGCYAAHSRRCGISLGAPCCSVACRRSVAGELSTLRRTAVGSCESQFICCASSELPSLPCSPWSSASRTYIKCGVGYGIYKSSAHCCARASAHLIIL